jgi:hypothetical protein
MARLCADMGDVAAPPEGPSGGDIAGEEKVRFAGPVGGARGRV